MKVSSWSRSQKVKNWVDKACSTKRRQNVDKSYQGRRVSVNATSGAFSIALRLVSFQVPLNTLPHEFLTNSPFQVPVMLRLSEDSSSSSTPSSRSPAKKALGEWPTMAAVPAAAPNARVTVPARLSANSACCSSRIVALAGKPTGGFTKATFHEPCSCTAFMVWAVGHAAPEAVA